MRSTLSHDRAQEQDRNENEARNRASLGGDVVYNAIIKEGEDELSRPTGALFW